MRVIRTEMYFSSADVQPLRDQNNVIENPGIAFAFFNLKQIDESLSDHKIDDWLIDNAIDGIFDAGDNFGVPPKSSAIKEFLGVAITGYHGAVKSESFLQALREGGTTNESVSDFAFNGDIVIEHSPPDLTTIAKAIRQSPTILLGTYTGIGIAGENYPLMLVTIPAGIIVFGAAVGVSKGLQNGLNKSIETWIKKKIK